VPIYEYACKSCDHTLDALQKMSDEPLVDCPECGKPDLKRLLSAPRFRLKGAGWYETDFKKDNQKNVHKSDSEPTKSDSKPDKSKTEKKPETKPKAKTKSDD
jgi:putative FmdB family regulatory protein